MPLEVGILIIAKGSSVSACFYLQATLWNPSLPMKSVASKNGEWEKYFTNRPEEESYPTNNEFAYLVTVIVPQKCPLVCVFTKTFWMFRFFSILRYDPTKHRLFTFLLFCSTRGFLCFLCWHSNFSHLQEYRWVSNTTRAGRIWQTKIIINILGHTAPKNAIRLKWNFKKVRSSDLLLPRAFHGWWYCLFPLKTKAWTCHAWTHTPQSGEIPQTWIIGYKLAYSQK